MSDPQPQPGPAARLLREGVQLVTTLAVSLAAVNVEQLNIPEKYRGSLVAIVAFVVALKGLLTMILNLVEGRRGAPVLTTSPAVNSRKARQLDVLATELATARAEGAAAAVQALPAPVVATMATTTGPPVQYMPQLDLGYVEPVNANTGNTGVTEAELAHAARVATSATAEPSDVDAEASAIAARLTATLAGLDAEDRPADVSSPGT